MQKFYMMVGLPGSGKSTCAKSIPGMGIGAVKVHASDAIREELLGTASDQTQQELVFKTLHERVLADLKDGKSVVYDATNIRYQDRKNFLDRVKALRNYDLKKVCIFMATPLDKCLENNAVRERNVPESVIRRMYRHIDTPMYPEGWDEIVIKGNEPMIERAIPLLLSRLATVEHDNPNHTLSVGNHMMEAFGYYTDHYDSIDRSDIAVGRAILLHDIGKKRTKVFQDAKGNPTEIAHYYGHERTGAYDSFAYTTDLDSRARVRVATLIRWHMAPFVVEASDNPGKTEKKFVRLLGEDIWNKVKIINDCDRHAH